MERRMISLGTAAIYFGMIARNFFRGFKEAVKKIAVYYVFWI